jgi:protein-disulfide isomerase
VRTDAGLGKLFNVSSTPTIYINGRKVNPSVLPPAYYDALIDIELKKTQN